MKRVVVTGMGVVTAVGNKFNDNWASIAGGTNGIDYITRFDTTDFRTKMGGEVRGFEAESYMDKKDAKRLPLFIQFALASAMMAL